MAKRKRQQGYYTKRMKAAQEGSNEEVLLADVRDLLQTHEKTTGLGSVTFNDEESDAAEPEKPFDLPERFSEVEVKISTLSSIGDGLGLSPMSNHVYVVPFTLPGDVVKAKVVTHMLNAHYTLADFISVLEPSPQRNDSLVQCPYFAKCSGCQLQMLPYEDQLAHKKTILQKAYRNFSNLASELIPVIGDTIGSPMQYGYRTKLTPHFDGPPGSHSRKARKDLSERQGFDKVPPIGFMVKGTRKTMDIEDCPIGTDAVRDGLKIERKRVADEISKYKRGATILLRETTSRVSIERSLASAGASTVPNGVNHSSPFKNPDLPPGDPPRDITPSYTETKTYLTDQNALSTEHIGSYIFLNPAGAFFQNNSSILPTFTSYIRSHILPPPSSFQVINSENPQPQIKYLIDTYSGSGLFSITLSSLFYATLGIDIAPSSIASANQNAKLNNIENATFVTGDAANIFAEAKKRFKAEESVVVVDPPRKGCDDGFLKQLLGWGPARVVYVSCNVHTQARDVGVLVRGGQERWGEEDGKGEKEGEPEREVGGEREEKVGKERETKGRIRYSIESLRGFDFFPQTGHVEGVAILQRVNDREGAVE
ncbi:MAG: hypothetical protein Q9201_001657 [Fulgogasparrea decipioides]